MARSDGVNSFNCCGAEAWQTVFHFHLHVILRYRDEDKDRMELPFEPGMPADADADAIAERARVLAAALSTSCELPRSTACDWNRRGRHRLRAPAAVVSTCRRRPPSMLTCGPQRSGPTT